MNCTLCNRPLAKVKRRTVYYRKGKSYPTDIHTMCFNKENHYYPFGLKKNKLTGRKKRKIIIS